MVFPAIDLRQGRCVRLTQGRFDAETRYSDMPLAVVAGFAEQGAQWLHLVDLDGAKDPAARQTGLVRELVRASGLKVQCGGGLRRREQVAELLELGCERVVLGSIALAEPETVAQWFVEFGPECLVLALDVHIAADGCARVARSGWQEDSGLALDEVLETFLPAGLRHVLCTDIARDGMLAGPNAALYAGLLARFPGLRLIASGGVGCLDDIRVLAGSGLAGVVTGKALYENRFTLKEALACSRGE
ncbi:MAG: 1-(5-phosphoribosyl)-5-[(5-phosphoribosylamino)methylideneamino]imidazole-4-carboxamide isomerase [Gammaproteobacteria bacterium]|nr:1-(5-phosphoribosyl)-5-[(5-phosphoribosylamino)methylideneamino]imidazole-4-carboxamide isomerase [Gammaproteobacteria bacterium]